MADAFNLPFSDFARHSRPSAWTWFEVIVAGGPISADGFAQGMQFAFEESKHVNVAPMFFPSFRDRLLHSDCEHLCPPWLPEVELQDVASWSGPPAKRIKLVQSDLSRGSSDSFIDPDKWRFPGFLATFGGEIGLA